MQPNTPPQHRGTPFSHPAFPLGRWPFKGAGCPGLSPGDPKGRVWPGTRGSFSCLLPAHGQGGAWLGLQGWEPRLQETLPSSGLSRTCWPPGHSPGWGRGQQGSGLRLCPGLRGQPLGMRESTLSPACVPSPLHPSSSQPHSTSGDPPTHKEAPGYQNLWEIFWNILSTGVQSQHAQSMECSRTHWEF